MMHDFHDLPDFLFQIPGTNHVALKGDAVHGAWAKKHGGLAKETHLLALPEIRKLTPNSTVLDIGAFVGDTTHMFESCGAEVWAFEPYPDAFTALRINCPYARKLNVAVGDGEPFFPAGEFGEPGNMGARVLSAGGTPTIRIDDLSIPRVHFIKIDVEGMEPAVFKGAAGTIRQHRPVILVEAYNSLLARFGYTRADIFNWLETLNYVWRVAVGREEDDRLDYIATPT